MQLENFAEIAEIVLPKFRNLNNRMENLNIEKFGNCILDIL